MKKRKTTNSKLWAIGVLAIVLFAVPSARAQGYVDCYPEDSPYNFYADDIDGLNIWPDATVHLYTSVPYVFVAPGGILNIYSGSIGMLAVSTANPDLGQTDAIVTVHGTDFFVDGVSVTTEFTPDEDFGSQLIATDEDGNTIDLYCYSDTAIKLVDIEEEEENDELIIDIKPGSDTNCINLKSRGVVPVAVITTDDFQAGNINPDSVDFAGASPVRSSLCDVDSDGDMDMLFHFRTQMLNLDETSTEATLKAMLKGASLLSRAAAGDFMEGTDKVKIMSSKKYRYSVKHAPKPKQCDPKPKPKLKRYTLKDKRSKLKYKDR